MIFEQIKKYREKLRQGKMCLGTCITFTDPTVTEALCNVLDFVWIDREHNPHSLETVQGHLLATRASETVGLVRVAWNDPVLIKPVLDIGAAGVIVPFVRTAEEAQRAVAACRYPPEGIRGYGPRRPTNYGRAGGPDYCKAADDAIAVHVQIEHIDAVRNLDEILAVPGVCAAIIGPNDLAASMGFTGQPRHPEVLKVIDTVIAKAAKAKMPVGLGSSDDPEQLLDWADRGLRWLSMGGDFSLMLRAASQTVARVKDRFST